MGGGGQDDDSDSVVSTMIVTNKYLTTDSSYATENMWTSYAWTKEPPTPAQKKLEDDYLKIRGKKEEIIAQAHDKNAKIAVRFRFWGGTFDAEGNENYSEDDIVIQDGKPGGKYEVYNVDYHVTKDGLTNFGQGPQGGWEKGFVHPYDELSPIELFLPSFPSPSQNYQPLRSNVFQQPPFLRPIPVPGGRINNHENVAYEDNAGFEPASDKVSLDFYMYLTEQLSKKQNKSKVKSIVVNVNLSKSWLDNSSSISKGGRLFIDDSTQRPIQLVKSKGHWEDNKNELSQSENLNSQIADIVKILQSVFKKASVTFKKNYGNINSGISYDFDFYK